jgi:hypothetical protein
MSDQFKLGATRVRLADGREGTVMGNTLEGVSVALDEGRAVWVPEKDLTLIEPPRQLLGRAEPQQVVIRSGLSVMRGGRWQ